MLQRYYDDFNRFYKKNKVLVIYGARRVGKTTLTKGWLANISLKYLYVTGDSLQIRNLLSSGDIEQIKEFVDGYQMIVIDEAQQIRNIGMGLKIMNDYIPELKIIATRSSSFELSRQIGDPLTGRKRVLALYPMAQCELAFSLNKYELKNNLEKYLIFGSYPEVITSETVKDKLEVIDDIVQSYLLRDILSLEKIRNPKVLFNLLKLLAFQIGSPVSVSELAKQLGINVKTVSRYLDLLEKSFIIFPLSSYSGNLRKEISKKSKYYFVDNGVRNGVIMQFNTIKNRNDIGQLWENFIISERIKKLSYERTFYNRYFWRNYNQQEIDLLEEYNGVLNTYEIKWGKAKTSLPGDFERKYGKCNYTVINRDNYPEFIL